MSAAEVDDGGDVSPEIPSSTSSDTTASRENEGGSGNGLDEDMCRICHDNPSEMVLISPCLCKELEGGQLLSEKIANPRNEGGSRDEPDEDICRICHDNPSGKVLITPCSCKGSISKVHKECLEQWLGQSSKKSCEICNFKYNTLRKPKYPGFAAIYQCIEDTFPRLGPRGWALVQTIYLLFWVVNIVKSLPTTPTDELIYMCDFITITNSTHCIVYPPKRNPLLEVHLDFMCSKDCFPFRLDYPDTTLVDYSNMAIVILFFLLLYSNNIVTQIDFWREWQKNENFVITVLPLPNGRLGYPPPPPVPRCKDSITFVDETVSVNTTGRTADRVAATPEMKSSQGTADKIQNGTPDVGAGELNREASEDSISHVNVPPPVFDDEIGIPLD